MTKIVETKKRYLTWGLAAVILGAIILYVRSESGPPLKPWHTEKLTAEFTARQLDKIKTFDDYRQLEDRLFAQLEKKIYARTETGAGYELVRYSKGSAADPQHREINWNRSVELPSNRPVGGALLLHGMSDSPYSLRALGETLNRHDYWVISLRLPGHGTVPSGLKTVAWEDMAAAVRLGVEHLASKVDGKPIHIVGYSTGAPLAIDFTLDALDGHAWPLPASLLLISPAIGIHPAAAVAGMKNRLSNIPGMGHLAWMSVQPEFDPYKYNSFATNAGYQVHRVTREVARRIADGSRSGSLENFPPTLVFKSTVDATVSVEAVIDSLFVPLGNQGHELVLFDINRMAAKAKLLIADPGPLTDRLMADATLPFTLTVVINENPNRPRVLARSKAPDSGANIETRRLGLKWPIGVISLSHVALPFPPDDPLYGQRPPDDENTLFLGQMAIQGERGLLRIPYESLMRMRHNPFYEYLEKRGLAWLDNAGNR